MIALEKEYLHLQLEKESVYLSHFVKKGHPLDKAIRYSFEEGTEKTCLLESPQGTSGFGEHSVAKFLFRLDRYETNLLNRHTCYNSGKETIDFKKLVPSIKKDVETGNFLIGCVLKQVKGGFTIDLGGLVCFMPYSLSEGTRFSSYSPKANTSQLFQAHDLSLVVTPEGDVFINLIVSRKNNMKLLKGVLKKFFDKNLSNLFYEMSNKSNATISRLERQRMRLISAKKGKFNTLKILRVIKSSKSA